MADTIEKKDMIDTYGYKLIDDNIEGYHLLVTPFELQNEITLTEDARITVEKGRKHLRDILSKKDPRILLGIGPCSVHDPDEFIEYGRELKELEKNVKDVFSIFIRAYAEKPRTGNDWEGLAVDPDLDGTCDRNKGLKITRKTFVRINELGLPVVTEFLRTKTPQYLDDLTAYAVIGARTANVGDYRQMASGLTMPVGIKNGVDGNVFDAINGIEVANSKTFFDGIDKHGRAAYIPTAGNRYAHAILRGGSSGGQIRSNYHWEDVEFVLNQLNKKDLLDSIVIDCSHGNSAKDHKRQPKVFNDVIRQICDGNRNIVGLMLESYIRADNQTFKYRNTKKEDLVPGVSITDKCINIQTTRSIMMEAYHSLKRLRY